MRIWELWEGPDGSHSFFPADDEKARRVGVDPGAAKVWEVEAPSHNAAMRAFHEHMGWEPYKPMLRDDGTPYPEDEGDNDRLST
jgi:hypothetical protein